MEQATRQVQILPMVLLALVPYRRDGIMIKETAWMFCRECKNFDGGEYPNRPCSGKAFDFVVKDDVAFMDECGYEFDESIIED